MGVTINVNNLSLAHKASNGVAMATIPDVCKTPSPGGPVPIPYPNIARSGMLSKGSKKVKADGGNMIAIKGSEFSMSNGDEAGVAGGVKSSTNMKEAKWILYSFDVKIEGKNACRLTDKMTMNHGNTVCLGGEMQVPVVVVDNMLQIDCASKDFSDCEKKQICAKCAVVNEQAKEKGKFKRKTKKQMKKDRVLGNAAAAEEREDWAGTMEAYPEKELKAMFWHPCAYDEWKKGGRDPELRDQYGKPQFSADHVHELQLGGHPHGEMRWMSKRANEFMGGSLKKFDPKKHKGVSANCC